MSNSLKSNSACHLTFAYSLMMAHISEIQKTKFANIYFRNFDLFEKVTLCVF